MENSIAHPQHMRAQLDDMRVRIERLKVQVGKVGAKAQPIYLKEISELQRRHQLASRRLSELENAGANDRSVTTSGIAFVWDSVRDALKSIRQTSTGH